MKKMLLIALIGLCNSAFADCNIIKTKTETLLQDVEVAVVCKKGILVNFSCTASDDSASDMEIESSKLGKCRFYPDQPDRDSRGNLLLEDDDNLPPTILITKALCCSGKL